MHTTSTSDIHCASRRRPIAADVLRGVLTLNGATSILGGAAALVAGGPVAHLLGTGHVDRVRIAGAGLLMFGLAVLALARRPAAVRARLAPAVSVVDLAWVGTTVVAVAGGWFSGRGDVVMSAVGLVVLDLSLAQTWSARRSAL